MLVEHLELEGRAGEFLAAGMDFLVDLLQFLELRAWLVARKHDAIQAERTLVRAIIEVSSVGKEGAGRRLRRILDEVEFEDGEGPFRLGFDESTSRLTTIEWDAAMDGRLRKAVLAMNFDDFREVDGILVGFAATMTVDGEEQGRESLEEISFNG